MGSALLSWGIGRVPDLPWGPAATRWAGGLLSRQHAPFCPKTAVKGKLPAGAGGASRAGCGKGEQPKACGPGRSLPIPPRLGSISISS